MGERRSHDPEAAGSIPAPATSSPSSGTLTPGGSGRSESPGLISGSIAPSPTTAAQPIGVCPNCGGTLYALLVHSCTSAVRATVTVEHFNGVGPIDVVVGHSTVEPSPVTSRPRLRLIQGGRS